MLLLRTCWLERVPLLVGLLQPWLRGEVECGMAWCPGWKVRVRVFCRLCTQVHLRLWCCYICG